MTWQFNGNRRLTQKKMRLPALTEGAP